MARVPTADRQADRAGPRGEHRGAIGEIEVPGEHLAITTVRCAAADAGPGHRISDEDPLQDSLPAVSCRPRQTVLGSCGRRTRGTTGHGGQQHRGQHHRGQQPRQGQVGCTPAANFRLRPDRGKLSLVVRGAGTASRSCFPIPLSIRTCGFPAYGLPMIFCAWLRCLWVMDRAAELVQVVPVEPVLRPLLCLSGTQVATPLLEH